MLLLSLKGKSDEGGTSTSSDISYESKDLDRLDPLAFTPIFEVDIMNAIKTSLPADNNIDEVSNPQKAKGTKRSSLEGDDPNALQRPWISPRNISSKKPSLSEEAVVL